MVVLILDRTQTWVERRDSYIPTALWNKAEEPLRNLAEGDALSILDCCFASTAAFKSRAEEFRTYQLLAASSAGSPTSGPGELSFTTALSKSLVELLEESQGANFPVTKLWESINKKRTDQASLIWDRLQKYKRSVQLAPLDPTRKQDASFQNKEPEKASLVLRLSLKVDDLTKPQIERLAAQLPRACQEAQIPVRRIDWVKLETVKRDYGAFLGAARTVRVAQKMREALRRNSVSRGRNDESPDASRGRKRTRSRVGSTSPSKRQQCESTSTSDGFSRASATPASSYSMGAVESLVSSND